MHYLGRLISITVSYSLLVAIIERVFVLITQRLLKSNRAAKASLVYDAPAIPPAEHIEPLRKFDYRTVEPIRYRPFESKRHVVMGTLQSGSIIQYDLRLISRIGIRKTTKSEWIRIDKCYLDRMNLRTGLLDQTPDVCAGSNEKASPAVRELYEEIMLDLLPRRYPTMFRIVGDTFHNLITGSAHRISKALKSPAAMLEHLGKNVEEDFYFMIPGADSEYVLEAFVSCFPQGLLPSAKVGMTTSQIHEPVPGYEGRLKKGVNRCFQRMERGQSIGRVNVCLYIKTLFEFTNIGQWAIQCNHDVLHLPFDGANTLKNKDSPSQRSGIDPLKSFLRVEHHTLTCLKRTGVIVFAVRSYLTPLSQIKSEGSGPALAAACECMPDKFGIYKNRPTWGENLCSWLREGESSPKQEQFGKPTQEGACPFSSGAVLGGVCPITS